MKRHGGKRTTRGAAVMAFACAACTSPSTDIRSSVRDEPGFVATDRRPDLLGTVRQRFRDGDEPVISAVVPSRRREDVALPERATDGTSLRDPATGLSITFSLLDAAPGVRSEIDEVAVFERGGPETSDLFMRRTECGVEDFLAFDGQSEREALRYLVDVRAVAGLRLVGDVLEFLDAGGAPRLRMDAPRLVDARGFACDARVVLEDCAADRDPSAPWGRRVIAPGRERCVVRVDWHRECARLRYPLLVDPTWTATSAMTAARTGHTATAVAGGKVLIVGGQHPSGATTTYLATTELYDPATNSFAAAAPLAQPRSLHAALALANGDVLVAGGVGAAGALTSTELYEATTQKFRAVGGLQGARAEAGMVELAGGKVLIAGGISGTTVLQTAEFFDSTTEKWTFTTSDMATRRFGHFLTKVPSGQGFVFGGASLAAGTLATGTAEYFSAATSAFSTAAPLATARHHFGTAVLSDHRILVAGGITNQSTETASSEIYDPTPASWSSAGNMAHARARAGLSALTTGAVVVTGGIAMQGTTKTYLKSAELYDPTAKAWQALPDMTQSRADHTSTPLSAGRVLVTGGSTSATAVTATAEVLALDKDGAACKSGATCASQQCVEGVCCESACATKCFGCANASTGLANGVCGPARAGTDPQGNCKDDGAPTCGQNGFCDGSGVCAKYAAKPCTPSACKDGADCTSGNCVDGVCCDTPCSGVCEACSAVKKGAGASGTCGSVANGTDPDAECGQMGTAPCAGNATCDGAGACRVPNAGKSCALPECSDAVTLSEAAKCSAAGDCTPTQTSCAPYRCDPTALACKTSCAAAADCAPGGQCVSGACHLKDDGASCKGDGECTSSHCVDGVCCETTCIAQCAACDVVGSAGKCVAVTGAPHGNRSACDGTPPCAGKCDGKVVEDCQYPGSETSCGSAVGCADGGPTEQKCNGFGRCANIPSKRCTPFACNEGACRTECDSDVDCASGYVCKDKACVSASTASCPDGGTGCVPGASCPDGGKSCAPTAAAGDDGGCGCRVGGPRGSRDGWLIALCVLGAGLVRRSRFAVVHRRSRRAH